MAGDKTQGTVDVVVVILKQGSFRDRLTGPLSGQRSGSPFQWHGRGGSVINASQMSPFLY